MDDGWLQVTDPSRRDPSPRAPHRVEGDRSPGSHRWRDPHGKIRGRPYICLPHLPFNQTMLCGHDLDGIASYGCRGNYTESLQEN